MVDETFPTYLEEARQQRAELGESMAALEAALTLPAGVGPVWRRRVRAALTELCHDLRDHAELTEADGGFYADIGVTAPRLTYGVEVQLNEHTQAWPRSSGCWPSATRDWPTTRRSRRTARRASSCWGGWSGTGSAPPT